MPLTVIVNDDENLALQAPLVNTQPGIAYAAERRLWQGIPGIERTEKGRLLATWYSGGENEGPENYILLASSEDDGKTWSEPLAVIDPPYPVRAFDPVLWRDSNGMLWWFWSQSYGLFDGRAGVWAMRCLDTSAPALRWTEPRRIFDGIMMNRPIVLHDGTWLAPAAVWSTMQPGFVLRQDMCSLRFSNVYKSTSQGETWSLAGQADVPNRHFDEHMIVERQDGKLWMLVRTFAGIGEAISEDGGAQWLVSAGNILEGPDSRFFIRRLRSGRLLLINHHRVQNRNNLTATLSENDGRTWYGHLLLDERADVSYPDGVESPDGVCYVIYDRERTRAKEILLRHVHGSGHQRRESGYGSLLLEADCFETSWGGSLNLSRGGFARRMFGPGVLIEQNECHSGAQFQ
ncbi:MAG: sialidase family protein [Terriglobales bacterium]